MNDFNQLGCNPFSFTGAQGVEPKKKKRRPENPPGQMRRDLDRLRLVVRPDHSIAELDSIMIEAERWLPRIGRNQTQAARSRLYKHILGCSLEADPQAVIVAASRYASDEAIRDFQLAAIDKASECFERFMGIVPRTAYAQDCLNEALLQTSWWLSLWEKFVRQHGDKTPHFFI